MYCNFSQNILNVFTDLLSLSFQILDTSLVIHFNSLCVPRRKNTYFVYVVRALDLLFFSIFFIDWIVHAFPGAHLSLTNKLPLRRKTRPVFILCSSF